MDTDYFLTMAIFKSMLNKNLITEEEFNEINSEMQDKYRPILSILI